MPCPDLQTLEEVAREATDPGTEAAVRAHCSTCADCRRTLDDARANRALESSLRDLVQRDAPRPERIGAFTILRELGRGAMGVVYLAEQDHPHRRVALKLLPSLHATAERRRRFADEIELLGRLRHPGIASIHEAGITTFGTDEIPYFAMEYVEGERIDRYVESTAAGEEEIVRLVAAIADAVHHAHGRGVLHRDLKPGNLLVETVDGVPTPRVLDFGVARALQRDGEEHTRAGQLVGTLPYMSPEQIAGPPGDLDARSDVYALGVVAYTLLSGRHPLDLDDCDPVEAGRRIVEQASTPLVGRGFAIRPDLATVVETALRKDPAQRYQSASEFAADLRRALRHEPIAARPLSARYQLAKLVQRYRAAVVAGGVGLALVVGLAVTMAVLSQRAREAERLARVEAESAESVADFLYGIFAEAVPRTRSADEVTARDLIEAGIHRLDTLESSPEVEGKLLFALGTLCRELALFEESEDLLTRSLARRREGGARLGRDQAQSLVGLGRLALDRGDPVTAEARFRESADAYRAAGVTGVPLASSLNFQGMAQTRQARWEDATVVLRDALERFRAELGPDDYQTASVANNLGVAYTQMKDYDAALEIFRATHATMERELGPDHVRVGSSHANLGSVLNLSGDPAAAEAHFRRALDIQSRVHGPDHPHVAAQWHRLGVCLAGLDRPREAEEALRTALRIREAAIPDHWFTAESASCLGLVLAEQGRREEAAALLRRGAEEITARRGPDDPYSVRARERWDRFQAERGGR